MRRLTGLSRMVPLAGIREDAASMDIPDPTRKAEFLRLLDLLAASPAHLRASVKKWQTWSKSQTGGYDGVIDGIWGWKSERAYISTVPYAYSRDSKLSDLLTIKVMAEGSALFNEGDLYAVGISRDQWLPTHREQYGINVPTPPVLEGEETRVEITLPTVPDEGDRVTITPVDESDPDAAIPRYVEITLPDGGTVAPGDRVVITPVEEDLTGGSRRRLLGWGLVALGGTIVLGSVFLAARQKRE